VKKISSSANTEFKQLRELVDSSRERRKAGLTVLDGIHLVQAYRDQVGAPERIVVSESGLLNNEIKQIVKNFSSSEILQASDGLFKQLSQLATPTGILAVVKTPRPQPVPADMDSCILLEDLQDPGNLGSILRAAAAAGVGHVLLSKNSVQVWSPRVVRAGMGAHFMLRIHEQADLLTAAAMFGGKVLAASRKAPQSLFDADLRGKIAFAFGNEGAGLSRQLRAAAHAEVSIPMPGKTESLNVAAAVAVCLFERVRQLGKQGIGNGE
jgi:TrmH family RNA methyltransferase